MFAHATRGWAVAFLLVAPMAMAKEHIIKVDWSGGSSQESRVSIAAGKFKELCAPLKKGERVEWSFSGAAASDFNIHYHVGKDTVYPVKVAAVRTGEGILEVPVTETFCWMWKAGTDSVDLSAKLSRKYAD